MRDTGVDEQSKLLRDLKQRALALELDEFCRQHEGYYLLGQLPAEDEDDWSFATDVQVFDDVPGRRSSKQATSGGERLLWKVEKTDRNAWKRRVSVGRATNNDIIIRHHSISKLHAHFLFGTLVKLRHLSPSADLLLADVGSANGTSIDGRRLEPDETDPVYTGNRLVFGDVSCELLDAKALYKKLRAIVL